MGSIAWVAWLISLLISELGVVLKLGKVLLQKKENIELKRADTDICK
jgi:hypothetical protein